MFSSNKNKKDVEVKKEIWTKEFTLHGKDQLLNAFNELHKEAKDFS